LMSGAHSKIINFCSVTTQYLFSIMESMKKLYGDFDKNDWLRISQMKESDVPETVILHGEDGNIADNIAEWEPAFESILCRPRWNMFVGSRKNKKVGFVNVCWAPMAALVVHKFAAMGTKRFIQIGYCGGLSEKLKYGEILIVQAAKAEEGVSNQYFSDRNIFNSSEVLVKKAEVILTSESFPFQLGNVVTTSAMFLETHKIISSWNHQGYIGVDGETSTTLAVAQKFGAEAISLLTCSDNLALGDNFYETCSDREDSIEVAFERIQNLALQLS
jgi:purine-nucleoside phosphorylase